MRFSLSFLLLALFLVTMLAKNIDGRKHNGEYWGKRAIEDLKFNELDGEGKSLPNDEKMKYTSFTKEFEPKSNQLLLYVWKRTNDADKESKEFEPKPNPILFSWLEGTNDADKESKEFKPKPNPILFSWLEGTNDADKESKEFEPKPNPILFSWLEEKDAKETKYTPSVKELEPRPNAKTVPQKENEAMEGNSKAI